MPILRSLRLFPLIALLAATAAAQTHRVEAPEKVIRSIGVYEWTGELGHPDAARLVPVSLFIEGTFQDGGTYYARPIPLALLNGNIYSLETAGVPQGTVTLDYARHLQTATGGTDNTIDLGWFGYGTFANMPVERKIRALHASATPPAIVSSKDDGKDNDRPTFVNRSKDASKSTTTTAPAADKRSSQPDTTASAPDDDPDRPHLAKDKAPASPPDKTTSTTSTQTSSQTPASPSTTAPSDKSANGSKEDTSPIIVQEKPEDDSDRPTLRHRDPKQAEADRKARDARNRSGVSAVGGLNDDPDRPNMRRGKTAGIGGAPATQLSGIPTGLHQMVAISDPANREPHPFARDWASPTERADILAKLEVIAQRQLATYTRTNGIEQPAPAATKPAPKPVPKTAAARRAAAARPAPAPAALPAAPLTGEQLASYTLSYGGLPTFVYTATSPAPTTTASTGATLPERYVTVVAQQLPSGELQTAFSSVTDAAHLDRTPWFRLVDAVDPDAEHRASLLFELRGHSSRQFALYRILSATAEQIFITHPTD
jgi:hypothetical protein